MRDDIIAHARQDAPRECCGLIAGDRAGLVQLFRLTNLDPGTDFYRMDDTELFHRYRAIEEAGQEIAVIYHSHPVSPAYPSPRDVQYAAWSDSYYVICSLAEPSGPRLRAFRIVDGQISEIPITTT